eukprot:gene10593-7272_t
MKGGKKKEKRNSNKGIVVQPAENPEGRCNFWAKSKNRFCRFQLKAGSRFCPQHQAIDGTAGTREERIPCPLDPKHTVYKHKLAGHLKKCNKAFTPNLSKLPYYTPNVNTTSKVPKADEGKVAATLSLRGLTPVALQALIAKVQAAAAEYVPELEAHTYDHPSVRAEINRCAGHRSNNEGPLRHLEQQASLIGTLDNEALLGAGACFVEFGAGRGKLLHFVSKAVGADTAADYLAIDREKTRLKFDRFHANTEHSRLDRVLMDIEHLVLDKVPLLQERPKPIVMLGKHLCGAATDLSLVCAMHRSAGSTTSAAAVAGGAGGGAGGGPSAAGAGGATGHGLQDGDQAPAEKRRKILDIITSAAGAGAGAAVVEVAVETPSSAASNATRFSVSEVPREDAKQCRGIVVALCCHQVCEWHRYCNPEYFRDELGFTADEFKYIALMSSWSSADASSASAATHRAVQQNAEVLLSNFATVAKVDPNNVELAAISTAHADLLQRATTLKYLEKNGYDARLQVYIDPSMTLENVILIAKPKKV